MAATPGWYPENLNIFTLISSLLATAPFLGSLTHCRLQRHFDRNRRRRPLSDQVTTRITEGRDDETNVA